MRPYALKMTNIGFFKASMGAVKLANVREGQGPKKIEAVVMDKNF